jgi:hypothetical protein
MKLPSMVRTLGRRILLTLLLVFTVTALAGTWELYPLLSTHSRNGEKVSVELVWIEVWRWVAIMCTSSLASAAAIALLTFAANKGGLVRTWTWVFVVIVLFSLPSLGTHWPERRLIAEGWAVDLPWLYEFWPLISVIPIVIAIHRYACGSTSGTSEG